MAGFSINSVSDAEPAGASPSTIACLSAGVAARMRATIAV